MQSDGGEDLELSDSDDEGNSKAGNSSKVLANDEVPDDSRISTLATTKVWLISCGRIGTI